MLSSISAIQETVGVSNDFSFVDTLGSFINNREFHLSYEDFQNGQSTTKSFVWEALSAIGNEVGKKIYENIRDYIDLVSNVDRCKVGCIQSMLQVYGEHYNIFDNITRYPVEVQNLIDIFSINRKYILRNNFLREDFKNDLFKEGVLEDIPKEKGELENVDGLVFNQDRFEQYIKNIFVTLFTDFLNLKYNDINGTYIRKNLTEEDLAGYSLCSYVGNFDDLKRELGVQLSFDEQYIVDEIDNGNDFLDNYVGGELSILNQEINRRAQKLTLGNNNQMLFDSLSSSIENKTKYSYYRKAKLLEYYNFLNNLFIEPTSLSNISRYNYDESYFLIGGDTHNKSLIKGTDGYEVNESLVDYAATTLKDIVCYICSLRDRLKLQTRKNYMRGTENLLRYLINQYMVDFAKTSYIFKDYKNELSDLLSTLLNHSVEQVTVEEYIDETEYFNISAQTNSDAISGTIFNNRYWMGYDNQRTDVFSDDDITKFYLRDLGLSSDCNLSDKVSNDFEFKDLCAFLDVIYNLGANSSYIDKATGLFSAKLSSNPDIYSITLYHALTALQYHYEEFQKYLLSDYPYEYPNDYLSNQISNVMNEYISGYLSAQYLSAVSSVYDKYIDMVYQISDDVDSLVIQYNAFLSDEYAFYYKQSSVKYCYTNYPSGYKYDYYIGNTDRYKGEKIYQKLTNLKTYSFGDSGEDSSNLVFRGLIDTIDYLSSNLFQLSIQYKNDYNPTADTIVNSLTSYGYTDLSTQILQDSLDDAKNFTKEQINSRIDYLKNLVAQVLETARNLKTELVTIETTFTNAIAQYDDDNECESLTSNTLYAFSLQSGHEKYGYTRVDSSSKPKKPDGGVMVKVKWGTTTYYYYTHDGGSYKCKKYNVDAYPTNGTIEKKVENLIERIQIPTAFNINGESDSIVSYIYGRMQEGIYASVLQTKSNLATLQESYNTLVATVQDIGLEPNIDGAGIHDNLEQLIQFLTTTDPQREFANDSVLASLNLLLGRIVNLNAQYTPFEDEYQDIGSDSQFTYYMKDFTFQSTRYSFYEMQKLLDYINETDNKNHSIIRTKIDEFFETYSDIKNRFDDIEVSASNELYNEYGSSGTFIEDQIIYLIKSLENDIDTRYYVGTQICLSILNVAWKYTNYISNDLSGYMSSTDPLSDVIQKKFDEYNYSDMDEYIQAQTFYDAYNGLCSDSDIYYNHKNITHPSRQYHPYLWNFVKYSSYIDDYSTIFNMNTIQQLNEEMIQYYIDRYIGMFGQSINLWCNDGIDYSGYSSRYENSNHYYSYRATSYQRVVDYDGAFYPEAVDFLLSCGYESCVESIQKGIRREQQTSSSFYDTYYKPLSLTNEELSAEIERITKFHESIEEIVKQHVENQVFDVYKYGLDFNNNSFILFKRYIDEEGNFYPLYHTSFKIKKHTPGNLWVRKSAYPFAFPAFAYECGNTQIDNFRALSSTLVDELLSSHNHLTGGSVYDFEFSKNKATMALMMKNNSPDILISFDTAKSFVCQINTNENVYTKRKEIIVADNIVDNNSGTGTKSNTRENVESLIGKDFSGRFTIMSCSMLSDVLDTSIKNVLNTNMSVIFSSDQISNVIPDLYSDIDGSVVEHLNSGVLSNWQKYIVETMAIDVYVSKAVSAVPETKYYEGYSNGMSYSLVGCLLNRSDNFYFVYAQKHLSADDTGISSSLDSVTNLKLINYINQKVASTEGILLPSKPTTDDVVVTMMNEQTLAAGYVVDSQFGDKTSTIDAYTVSGSVIGYNNSEGYVYEDPFNTEMNSHDVFTSDIVLKRFSIDGLKLKEINGSQVFNQNADISYLPLYPGVSAITDIMALAEVSGNSYHSMELLGQSKNIDDLIARVNPTPNPYFSIEDISSNHVFGRVYEDYVGDYDKTLKILENPSINNNLPTDKDIIVASDNSYFMWQIDLSVQFEKISYTEKDYNQMKILMFNRDTYGKNPYFMCDLSTAQNNEIYAFYNDDNDGFEVLVTSNVDAVGTYDNKDIATLENNRLNNISKIGMKFIRVGFGDNVVRKLQIKFYLEDNSIEKVNHTFINAKQICLCLLNDRDISMFKYYHYLDAYGLYISGESLDFSEFENDIHDDGSVIEYDQDFISQKLSGIWNYHYNKYGQKQYLRDIDFDNYNALSDIEVLQGYKKAIFKYDEELYFKLSDDNYYYPTINLKYPKSMGVYVNEVGATMKVTQNVDLTKIFHDYELFIVDVPNLSAITEALKQVRIDISTDNSDYLMVDEDFYDTSVDNKYSHDDVRILEHVMFCQIDNYDINVSVDVEKRYIEDVEDELSAKGLFPLCCEDGIIVETTNIDVSNVASQLKKLLRLYINYKKGSGEGITLYFNYFNYLNTPFIRVEDFKVYSDIIEGTYLKIGPGESGRLDLIIQFRQYTDGEVRGYNNLKIATYQIHNVSDDKPKFVIKEIYRIDKDQNIEDSRYIFNIYGRSQKLTFPSNMEYTQFRYRIYWETVAQIKTIKFDLMYNGRFFNCIQNDIPGLLTLNHFGSSVDEITITNPTKKYIDLDFICLENNGQMNADFVEDTEFIVDEIVVTGKKITDEIMVTKVVNGVISNNRE